MNFSLLLSKSLYFWFFLSSLFFGASLSRCTRFYKKDSNIEKEKNRKWVLVIGGLTLSIVFILLGLVFSSASLKNITDFKLLLFFLFLSLYFFMVFRFKIAIGLPSFLVIILLILFILLFLQSIRAFTGETEIARVRILSYDNDVMALEVKEKNRAPVTFTLRGDYFAPLVKVIIFDDILVFMGQKTWYRFVGFMAFEEYSENNILKYRQTETDYYFKRPAGISEDLYSFYEKNERSLRFLGVKTVQQDIAQKRVLDDYKGIQEFTIRVQNDGGIQIVTEQ